MRGAQAILWGGGGGAVLVSVRSPLIAILMAVCSVLWMGGGRGRGRGRGRGGQGGRGRGWMDGWMSALHRLPRDDFCEVSECRPAITMLGTIHLTFCRSPTTTLPTLTRALGTICRMSRGSLFLPSCTPRSRPPPSHTSTGSPHMHSKR